MSYTIFDKKDTFLFVYFVIKMFSIIKNLEKLATLTASIENLFMLFLS